jgi:hypothetical protein
VTRQKLARRKLAALLPPDVLEEAAMAEGGTLADWGKALGVMGDEEADPGGGAEAGGGRGGGGGRGRGRGRGRGVGGRGSGRGGGGGDGASGSGGGGDQAAPALVMAAPALLSAAAAAAAFGARAREACKEILELLCNEKDLYTLSDPPRLRGRAVQVDPVKSTLKAPGTKRLKLECEESLSNFAFKFNLCRYTKPSCSRSCPRARCSPSTTA